MPKKSKKSKKVNKINNIYIYTVSVLSAIVVVFGLFQAVFAPKPDAQMYPQVLNLHDENYNEYSKKIGVEEESGQTSETRLRNKDN